MNLRAPLLILLFWAVQSQTTISSDSFPRARIAEVMHSGEELVYEVSWTFIKLGRIRVKTQPAITPGAAFGSIAFSDSYDLPFVDFHAVSTTEMDSSLFSKGATHYENKDGNEFKQIYHFNPSAKILVTENILVKGSRAQASSSTTFDTLKASSSRFQDGTSILYYARAHVHDRQGVRVPTFVRGKAGFTNFYFPSEQRDVSIDVLPYPIRTREFEGLAEFEGIFGLTGEFTGWFSDDAAAVPIKATMKIILGSIAIELKEWKRPGWTPPSAE